MRGGVPVVGREVGDARRQAGDEAVDRQRFEDDAGREGQYLAVVDSQ